MATGKITACKQKKNYLWDKEPCFSSQETHLVILKGLKPVTNAKDFHMIISFFFQIFGSDRGQTEWKEGSNSETSKT